MPATTELPIGHSTEVSADLLQKHDSQVGVMREFTWLEVNQLVAANRLELLGRTTLKELQYRADMHEVRAQYGSVATYIRQVKLAAFIADSSEQFLLVLNDYPYAVPNDAQHYIVWSKTELSPGCVPDPDVEAFIVERLGAQTDGAYEWVWFVNPPYLQSIPEVVHGHLIVRTVALTE
ncbi:hypothetical protein IW136_005897 [Coemansia sp. RSA 678]|nr:hypothetical protein IW136_005897 [Coemansia sp. RSA 678]